MQKNGDSTYKLEEWRHKLEEYDMEINKDAIGEARGIEGSPNSKAATRATAGGGWGCGKILGQITLTSQCAPLIYSPSLHTTGARGKLPGCLRP